MHEYVNRLPGLRVAILATDGFEETELLEPRQALNAAGAVTVLIAPKSGQLHAMKHDPKTGTVNVDLTFDHANPADFDAALLPGGALNADSLRMNPSAQYFIRRMDAERKPIAVICHGSWLLISAGLMPGRTLTSSFAIQADIRNARATWLDQEVVHYENWVSSRQPADIRAFKRKMLSVFGEAKSRGEIPSPARARQSRFQALKIAPGRRS
jgi:protease I